MSKMYYGHQPASSKQIAYAASLARKINVGFDAADLLMWHYGWSRSKATSKMSKQTISAAIDAALDQ